MSSEDPDLSGKAGLNEEDDDDTIIELQFDQEALPAGAEPTPLFGSTQRKSKEQKSTAPRMKIEFDESTPRVYEESRRTTMDELLNDAARQRNPFAGVGGTSVPERPTWVDPWLGLRGQAPFQSPLPRGYLSEPLTTLQRFLHEERNSNLGTTRSFLEGISCRIAWDDKKGVVWNH